MTDCQKGASDMNFLFTKWLKDFPNNLQDVKKTFVQMWKLGHDKRKECKYVHSHESHNGGESMLQARKSTKNVQTLLWKVAAQMR